MTALDSGTGERLETRPGMGPLGTKTIVPESGRERAREGEEDNGCKVECAVARVVSFTKRLDGYTSWESSF
jgi:hypothetical protein